MTLPGASRSFNPTLPVASCMGYAIGTRIDYEDFAAIV